MMKGEMFTTEEAEQRRADALARGCKVTYCPASDDTTATPEHWDLGALFDAYDKLPEGVDAHAYAAAKALNTTVEAVTPAQRQQAKRLSFAQRYAAATTFDLDAYAEAVARGAQDALKFERMALEGPRAITGVSFTFTADTSKKDSGT